ncbi:hypothetical protein Y032_0050g2037 [Ancylostoma ceylanicum]|uniref:Uncharacterized protein n=1 Tax=Ancylostoma ceylanicum TaxID=53326 RepID=A0A016U944_9BILA|nr:hypothetical protein Y032_0050g2037 [Ancylostoma ceylanicum]
MANFAGEVCVPQLHRISFARIIPINLCVVSNLHMVAFFVTVPQWSGQIVFFTNTNFLEFVEPAFRGLQILSS